MNTANLNEGLQPIESVKIHLKGYHIPSFKNRKRFGSGRVFTEKKIKDRMDRIIRDIRSQLNSDSRMTAEGILTVASTQSWIALFDLPRDDAWQWIPEIHITGVKVAKGEEGCVITLERIK